MKPCIFVEVLGIVLDGSNELAALLEQILKTIEDNPSWSKYGRHIALFKISKAIKQLTDAAIAKLLLEKSLALTNGITRPEVRDEVLAAIAVTYGHFNHWDDALKILEPLPDDKKTEALIQILQLWVKHHQTSNSAA